MLKSLAVKGFKSLVDTGPIEFAPVTVLFGPNGAGKSNVLDALTVLRHAANTDDPRTLLVETPRGRMLETFSFPAGGLPELIQRQRVCFELAVKLTGVPHGAGEPYTVRIEYEPQTGRLARRETPEAWLEQVSAVLDLASWRSYYLEPRLSMRSEQSPAPVDDIGALGEHLVSFLYRVKNEQPQTWAAIRRTLRVFVPAVESVDVQLDERRGTLDLDVREGGISYSSRLVSEGTLRVLALIAALTNPFSGLVAFEEPENGVHPRRIELIARLLVSQAIEAQRPKQIVVTTHSPILCGAMVGHAREHPGQIALLRVTHGRRGTLIKPFDPNGPAFQDEGLRRQLATVDDESIFEGLILRGLLDD